MIDGGPIFACRFPSAPAAWCTIAARHETPTPYSEQEATLNLVIFDIDGTLIESTAVDDACFLRAAEEVLDVRSPDADWANYPHCSDTGLVSELLRRYAGREARAEDIEQFRRRFLALLEDAVGTQPSLFGPIPGIHRLLELLAQRDDIAVALATGGFEVTARAKLEWANLPLRAHPAAFSEDGPSRESIVTAAVRRAGEAYGRTDFDRIISIGDGVWDVRTAASLGVGFVGRANAEDAGRLRRAGAEVVIADYLDEPEVLRTILAARAPDPRA